MIYYEEHGNKNGKLAVFIHGGFTTSEAFMKQYHLLKDYHCVFVDLPGHGKSACDRNYRFSFEDAAKAVIEVINFLASEEKVILISHSYGGITAKLIMEKIPERIEKAVIGSTNVKKTMLYRLYCGKIGSLLLMLQNRKRYKRENITWKRVCDSQKSAWLNFNLPKRKIICEIPALLLYAQYDIKPIKESMLIWKACFRHSKLVEIKEAGHNYFWDNAEKVNLIIKDFICEKN